MNESIFKEEARFTVNLREKANGSYGWEMKIRAQTLKELETNMTDARELIKRKTREWSKEVFKNGDETKKSSKL